MLRFKRNPASARDTTELAQPQQQSERSTRRRDLLFGDGVESRKPTHTPTLSGWRRRPSAGADVCVAAPHNATSAPLASALARERWLQLDHNAREPLADAPPVRHDTEIGPQCTRVGVCT